MKKYLGMSSAAVVIGALRVNKVISRELIKSSDTHKIKFANIFCSKKREKLLHLKSPSHFFGQKNGSTFVYNLFENVTSHLAVYIVSYEQPRNVGIVSWSADKFLARLFSKKTSRYCHSPGIVGGGIVLGVVRKL